MRGASLAQVQIFLMPTCPSHMNQQSFTQSFQPSLPPLLALPVVAVLPVSARMAKGWQAWHEKPYGQIVFQARVSLGIIFTGPVWRFWLLTAIFQGTFSGSFVGALKRQVSSTRWGYHWAITVDHAPRRCCKLLWVLGFSQHIMRIPWLTYRHVSPPASMHSDSPTCGWRWGSTGRGRLWFSSSALHLPLLTVPRGRHGFQQRGEGVTHSHSVRIASQGCVSPGQTHEAAVEMSGPWFHLPGTYRRLGVMLQAICRRKKTLSSPRPQRPRGKGNCSDLFSQNKEFRYPSNELKASNGGNVVKTMTKSVVKTLMRLRKQWNVVVMTV